MNIELGNFQAPQHKYLLMDKNGARTLRRAGWYRKVEKVNARLMCAKCRHEYEAKLSFIPKEVEEIIGYCPKCIGERAFVLALMEVSYE